MKCGTWKMQLNITIIFILSWENAGKHVMHFINDGIESMIFDNASNK